MTLAEINKALTVRKLDGEMFSNGKATYACKGYALHVEGKGFIAFTADATPEGVVTPYALTREKYIRSIVSAGGFCSFNGMQFVKPVKQ